MAVNPWLNNPTNPDMGMQSEFEKLWIESIQAAGCDFYYLPRKFVNKDFLFGEDTLSKFDKAHKIEMLIENVNGWDGDSDFISKFGLEIRNQMKLVMSKTRWFEVTAGHEPPKEGDLIYFPLSKGLFEITYADLYNPFFQHSKLYAYNITCEAFSFSQEDIETNLAEIDQFTVDFNNNGDDELGDPFANNAELEAEGDTITDFDETNPYGEDPF